MLWGGRRHIFWDVSGEVSGARNGEREQLLKLVGNAAREQIETSQA